MSHHDYVMKMVAAIIERGDDQLRDGKSGSTYSDGHWVIDLLLGELGYELHITEDGDVEIWPKDHTRIGVDGQVYTADNYRIGEVNGKWYHTEKSYRDAVELSAAMDTLDKMAQR